MTTSLSSRTELPRDTASFTSFRLSFTSACNMNCFYCHNEGQAEDVQSPQRNVDLGKFKQAAIMLKAAGLQSPNITGGEFAFQKQWRELFHITRTSFDGQIIVTTNGSLLDEADLLLLLRGGVVRFNVSIDSAESRTFREITGSPSASKVVSTVAKLSALGCPEIVINTVLLRNVNDSVEAMRALARAIHAYAKRVNIIRPYSSRHRPRFNGAPIDYYFQFMNRMKSVADSFEERYFEHDNSMNAIITLSGVRFHFKNVVPDYSVKFCAGCGHKEACTEWIIPPRFHIESGVFSACMLNEEKRVAVYDRLGDASATSSIRDLLSCAAMRGHKYHHV